MCNQKTLILKSKHIQVMSIIDSASYHSENDFKKVARRLCKKWNVLGKEETTVSSEDYIYDAKDDKVSYRYD